MRLLIQNLWIDAAIDAEGDESILTLDYECSRVEPALAHAHHFEILEATEDERRALRLAGYRMPDHGEFHGRAA